MSLDGVVIRTDQSGSAGQGHGPFTTYQTFGVANRVIPSQWGLSTAEVRYQVANDSLSFPEFAGMTGVDTLGWLIASTRFWRTRDDIYLHVALAVRTWVDRDMWLRATDAFPFDGFALKTAGVSFMTSREPVVFPS